MCSSILMSCDNGERVRVEVCTGLRQGGMNWVTTTKGIDVVQVRDLMKRAEESRFGANGKTTQSIEWLKANGSWYKAAIYNNEKSSCKSN